MAMSNATRTRPLRSNRTAPFRPIRKTRRTRNRALMAAAALSFTTLGVHIGLGTPEVLEPVLQSNAPAVAREVTRACWHLISLSLLAMAASYVYGVGRRTPALILTWNLLAVAFGIVFVVVAIASDLGFARVPQSFAFFAIAGTGFAGLHRSLYLAAPPVAQRWIQQTTALTAMPDRAPSNHRPAH